MAAFMTRDESATRSITQVRLDGSRGVVSLTWWPRAVNASIDPAAPGARLEMPLVPSDTLLAEGRR
jgi:hypothetical protein